MEASPAPMELDRTLSADGSASKTPGFYAIELNKTLWEVPLKYQDLTQIGTGAYGSVW